jgi:hypothetical protein
MHVTRFRLLAGTVPIFMAALFGMSPASASAGSGVGNLPQGPQSDTAYAASFSTNNVTNVDATTQQTSCYTPEVPYATNLGPAEGYSGESTCLNKHGKSLATTGEDVGPYPATQSTSNPGFPAASPMLVKDHSESDIRVDPTNPSHVVGSSKWFVSPEGYNHALGFYESFDGGATFSVQGHIPGYEGWTDNTDPVGAFDGFGNYYEFILAYQFFYNSDGSHNSTIGTMQEPNPGEPAEVVSVAVRPHGSTSATQWLSTHNGGPDFVATYDSIGNEPDKQWMAIDTNKTLPNGQLNPHYNRIYVMWVDFHTIPPVPLVSFADAHADGTHTDWAKPIRLPEGAHHPNGDTYLLPHVTPDGNIYTTLTNETVQSNFTDNDVVLDRSTDGGQTWSTLSDVIDNVVGPVFCCDNNTTFRDGIFDTFTTSSVKVGKNYPLYVSWEDDSTGHINTILSASFDGGFTWSPPIQVNDNMDSNIDEFQPNLTAASNGTVSVAFYDRRLACPEAGSQDAVSAGLALDTVNANFSGSLPPYGASNYCVNASIQFYKPDLTPIGHNIRISADTWDPQLNAAHYSRASVDKTFIGDYFGNTTAGSIDYTTSVSTFNDGTNPDFRQQQIVATIAVP